MNALSNNSTYFHAITFHDYRTPLSFQIKPELSDPRLSQATAGFVIAELVFVIVVD